MNSCDTNCELLGLLDPFAPPDGQGFPVNFATMFVFPFPDDISIVYSVSQIPLRLA